MSLLAEVTYWYRAAGLAFLALPVGWYAEHVYRSVPRLPQMCAPPSLPSLSIVVPARNEEENLAHLLPSLQRLRYPGVYEIIVVDDHSSDTTGAVAAAGGAQVIRLEELPAGWLGKPHACHCGALAAQGEWLLFTDADTVHAVDGPGNAVAYVVERGLDGLSLFLHQEFRSLTDRVVLASAFAGLFAGFSRKQNILNGQYILLKRQVYLDSQGFAAVRSEALEDVALGNHLHRQGYTVPLLHGENAAAVRMYETLGQMWHGMSRLGSDSLRFAGWKAIWSILLVTAVMSPLLTAVYVARGEADWFWLPITWAVATISMFPWARRFGPSSLALCAPLGAVFVQVAAVWGLVSRMLGRGIRWKGRKV